MKSPYKSLSQLKRGKSGNKPSPVHRRKSQANGPRTQNKEQKPARRINDNKPAESVCERLTLCSEALITI